MSCTNGSKIVANFSGVMPMPVSAMETARSTCPDVRPYLKHKLEMAHASTADLVRRARQAIKDATYGYYDHWDRRYGHDEVPDYSLVKEYFGRIRDAGDDVLLVSEDGFGEDPKATCWRLLDAV